MKKCFLSIVLSLSLVLALLPQAALAADYIEVLPPKYEWIGAFHEGMAFFKVEDENGNDKYGFIDKNGTEIVPPIYTSVSDFSEGLAAVSVGEWISNETWGYIDKTGKVVIPIKYDGAESFSEGLARVLLRKGDGGSLSTYGFIDKTGNMVIPFDKYRSAENFSDGLASVTDIEAYYRNNAYGDRHCYIDRTGNEVILLDRYDTCGPFSEGFVMALDTENETLFEGIGYLDKTGAAITPFKYTTGEPFSEGMAAVSADGYNNWGFIDKTGKEVVPPAYTTVSDFSNGLAVVNIGGRTSGSQWGFIDKSGQFVVPFGKYDYVMPFSEGLAVVSVGGYFYSFGEYIKGYTGGTWSCIDTTGREVISCKDTYDSMTRFSDGMLMVEVVHEVDSSNRPIRSTYGLIDKTGKEIVPPTYHRLDEVNDGMAVFEGSTSYLRDNIEWVTFTGDGVLSIPGATPYISESSTEPIPVPIATPTNSKVLIDGKEIAFDAYTISGNNYFKLRDVAQIVNGSNKQFEVTWDGANNAVNLVSQKSYTPVGGELTAGKGTTQSAVPSTSTIYKDGATIALAAYTINGNNYFKLRDLGQAFNFNVSWDGANNAIIIDTASSYTAD